MTTRNPSFGPPAGGWQRWSSESTDATYLKTLFESGVIPALGTAIDCQNTYRQFQKYNPTSFSKHFNRIKREVQVAEVARMPGVYHNNNNDNNNNGGSPPTMPSIAECTASVSSSSSIPSTFSGPQRRTAENGINSFQLPTFIDKWFDGKYLCCAVRIWTLSGTNMDVAVSNDHKQLICRVRCTANATDPRYALSKFRDTAGSPLYSNQHVRTVAFRSTIIEMTDPVTQRVLFEHKVDLPFKVDPVFSDKQGFAGKKMIKYSKTGEVWVHVQLIEEGAVQHDFSGTASVAFSPPANISVASNSIIRDDDDDVTMALSTWSSPSASYETIRSRRSTRSSSRATTQNSSMPPPQVQANNIPMYSSQVIPPSPRANANAPGPRRSASNANPTINNNNNGVVFGGLAEMAAAMAIARGSAASISTEQANRLQPYLPVQGGTKRRALNGDESVAETTGAETGVGTNNNNNDDVSMDPDL